MNSYHQQQWIYTQRPSGRVSQDNYQLRQQPLVANLAANEVLVEAKYISVDPYMRIQQHEKPSWEAPHPLNTVQGASVVGQVVESAHDDFPIGQWVTGYLGWQSHAIVHGNELEKLDSAETDVKTALGVLGMPGRTAWFGLMDAGKPKPGETVVVSGAAGAVGSLVVQFAAKAGCQVVAIAGSEEKCQWLSSIGADVTLNYRDYPAAGQMLAALKDKVSGVDVYFDNIGGPITDAVLNHLNLRARVIICGQMSQYDGGLDNPALGPRFLHHMLYQRATIQGILARDYKHRMPEMIRHVAPWLQQGDIEFKTSVLDGFHRLPEALGGLFEGREMGKVIVAV